MANENSSSHVLEDIKVNIKIKLSALWVSTMLCYIYGDYFGLYKPGALDSILAGNMEPIGPVTQGVLLVTSILMAVPSIMVILCIVLKPTVSRWLNVILGAFYTIIMLVTVFGSWSYYVFLGIIEMALTSMIVWYAWTWPIQNKT